MATVFEVRDEVWEVIEPMLPRDPSRRPAVRVSRTGWRSTRSCSLITGIAWRFVPRELGRSGVTAWWRLRDWEQSGVWERALAALLERLNAAGAIDWSAAVVDGSDIRALQGGLDRAVSR